VRLDDSDANGRTIAPPAAGPRPAHANAGNRRVTHAASSDQILLYYGSITTFNILKQIARLFFLVEHLSYAGIEVLTMTVRGLSNHDVFRWPRTRQSVNFDHKPRAHEDNPALPASRFEAGAGQHLSSGPACS
jgi:hypothetical protein